MNHLYRVTNPDNSYSPYLYDSQGNRTSVKDPKTNETTYEYDSLNQLAATIQPGTITTSLGYDGQGNLSSVTDGSRTYSYNQNNRLIQATLSRTILGIYSYNAQRQRVIKRSFDQRPIPSNHNATPTPYVVSSNRVTNALSTFQIRWRVSIIMHGGFHAIIGGQFEIIVGGQFRHNKQEKGGYVLIKSK